MAKRIRDDADTDADTVARLDARITQIRALMALADTPPPAGKVQVH
ncbi:hypothetical protein [Falsiruegeria litorea]|nr:hypothetical protein [Falsiruegeria litorea]MBT8169672.1 hypothetical protein [Falsiruegeria litorea]